MTPQDLRMALLKGDIPKAEECHIVEGPFGSYGILVHDVMVDGWCMCPHHAKAG